MYYSVLFEWLERLNINVRPNLFYHCVQPNPELEQPEPEHLILIKNFATFNMKTYRKHGTAYTDLFKIKMKKSFMEIRRNLARDRIRPLLLHVYSKLGFKLSFEEVYPFASDFVDEACIVQDYEYEEYMKLFLNEVEKVNKSEKDFEMETCFACSAHAHAHMNMIDEYYILPQEIYMSIGRFALLLHQRKWKHDQETGLENKIVQKKKKN